MLGDGHAAIPYYTGEGAKPDEIRSEGCGKLGAFDDPFIDKWERQAEHLLGGKRAGDEPALGLRAGDGANPLDLAAQDRLLALDDLLDKPGGRVFGDGIPASDVAGGDGMDDECESGQLAFLDGHDSTCPSL